MTKLIGIVGLFFGVMGFFALWNPLLRSAGYGFETLAFVNLVSLWGGLALLCVAAGLTIWQRHRRTNSHSEN